ncbi:MAG TPA: enoyl-CoA hydratase-related protein [Thermoanaerobaculia bacterium]|nr:enoyl-CoA hydratase-related protein [Thermoanaerobaculia bacterium]
MKAYKTLLVDERDKVVTVALNRPEVHNAFNDELIVEGIDLFGDVANRFPLARAIVLQGTGPTFCAGADLNWMSRMVAYSREENVRDSSLLAKLFAIINECSLPVIGRIEGAAIGGGVGLVSVCDIAFATSGTKFGLSEVKLGILPAVISPYVIAKIGTTHARALFLTGERFGTDRALKIGLIHGIAFGAAALDEMIAETVKQLKGSGPEAVRECKRLIAFVAANQPTESIPYTIEAIAERRTSDEGQKGMAAFLKKEKAPWTT